jgi:hypothetical protein
MFNYHHRKEWENRNFVARNNCNPRQLMRSVVDVIKTSNFLLPSIKNISSLLPGVSIVSMNAHPPLGAEFMMIMRGLSFVASACWLLVKSLFLKRYSNQASYVIYTTKTGG